MSKQIRVYNDMQTAMKNCKYKVKLFLTDDDVLQFEVYKEKIDYIEDLLVIGIDTKPNEVFIGRFETEEDAKNYGETLLSIHKYAVKIFNTYNVPYKAYKTFNNLKGAYLDSKFFVTEGPSGALHINRSIILQTKHDGFKLCYPAPKNLIKYSSKNRRDCVKFIKDKEVNQDE